MALSKDQIMGEITKLRAELKELSEKKPERVSVEEITNTSSLIRYFLEERDRTGRLEKALSNLTEQVRKLAEDEVQQYAAQMPMGQYEIPISSIDAKVLNFIKTQQNEMICADDLKSFMKYNGRNAACSRLKKLESMGFLSKFQLGHKVYYKYDAGKTTNALIISPPQ
jgi:hypothetical protein